MMLRFLAIALLCALALGEVFQVTKLERFLDYAYHEFGPREDHLWFNNRTYAIIKPNSPPVVRECANPHGYKCYESTDRITYKGWVLGNGPDVEVIWTFPEECEYINEKECASVDTVHEYVPTTFHLSPADPSYVTAHYLNRPRTAADVPAPRAAFSPSQNPVYKFAKGDLTFYGRQMSPTSQPEIFNSTNPIFTSFEGSQLGALHYFDDVLKVHHIGIVHNDTKTISYFNLTIEPGYLDFTLAPDFFPKSQFTISTDINTPHLAYVFDGYGDYYEVNFRPDCVSKILDDGVCRSTGTTKEEVCAVDIYDPLCIGAQTPPPLSERCKYPLIDGTTQYVEMNEFDNTVFHTICRDTTLVASVPVNYCFNGEWIIKEVSTCVEDVYDYIKDHLNANEMAAVRSPEGGFVYISISSGVRFVTKCLFQYVYPNDIEGNDQATYDCMNGCNSWDANSQFNGSITQFNFLEIVNVGLYSCPVMRPSNKCRKPAVMNSPHALTTYNPQTEKYECSMNGQFRTHMTFCNGGIFYPSSPPKCGEINCVAGEIVSYNGKCVTPADPSVVFNIYPQGLNLEQVRNLGSPRAFPEYGMYAYYLLAGNDLIMNNQAMITDRTQGGNTAVNVESFLPHVRGFREKNPDLMVFDEFNFFTNVWLASIMQSMTLVKPNNIPSDVTYTCRHLVNPAETYPQCIPSGTVPAGHKAVHKLWPPQCLASVTLGLKGVKAQWYYDATCVHVPATLEISDIYLRHVQNVNGVVEVLAVETYNHPQIATLDPLWRSTDKNFYFISNRLTNFTADTAAAGYNGAFTSVVRHRCEQPEPFEAVNKFTPPIIIQSLTGNPAYEHTYTLEIDDLLKCDEYTGMYDAPVNGFMGVRLSECPDGEYYDATQSACVGYGNVASQVPSDYVEALGDTKTWTERLQEITPGSGYHVIVQIVDGYKTIYSGSYAGALRAAKLFPKIPTFSSTFSITVYDVIRTATENLDKVQYYTITVEFDRCALPSTDFNAITCPSTHSCQYDASTNLSTCECVDPATCSCEGYIHNGNCVVCNAPLEKYNADFSGCECSDIAVQTADGCACKYPSTYYSFSENICVVCGEGSVMVGDDAMGYTCDCIDTNLYPSTQMFPNIEHLTCVCGAQCQCDLLNYDVYEFDFSSRACTCNTYNGFEVDVDAQNPFLAVPPCRCQDHSLGFHAESCIDCSTLTCTDCTTDVFLTKVGSGCGCSDPAYTMKDNLNGTYSCECSTLHSDGTCLTCPTTSKLVANLGTMDCDCPVGYVRTGTHPNYQCTCAGVETPNGQCITDCDTLPNSVFSADGNRCACVTNDFYMRGVHPNYEGCDLSCCETFPGTDVTTVTTFPAVSAAARFLEKTETLMSTLSDNLDYPFRHDYIVNNARVFVSSFTYADAQAGRTYFNPFDSYIRLPPNVVSIPADPACYFILSMVVHEFNPFANLFSEIQSNMYTLDIYRQCPNVPLELVDVKQLDEPIEFEMIYWPLSGDNMGRDESVTCSFWDEDALAISQVGCTTLSNGGGRVRCACDHLTSFFSIFKAQFFDVITNNNLSLLTRMSDLRFDARNPGFWLVLALSIFFIGVFVAAWVFDRMVPITDEDLVQMYLNDYALVRASILDGKPGPSVVRNAVGFGMGFFGLSLPNETDPDVKDLSRKYRHAYDQQFRGATNGEYLTGMGIPETSAMAGFVPSAPMKTVVMDERLSAVKGVDNEEFNDSGLISPSRNNAMEIPEASVVDAEQVDLDVQEQPSIANIVEDNSDEKQFRNWTMGEIFVRKLRSEHPIAGQQVGFRTSCAQQALKHSSTILGAMFLMAVFYGTDESTQPADYVFFSIPLPFDLPFMDEAGITGLYLSVRSIIVMVVAFILGGLIPVIVHWAFSLSTPVIDDLADRIDGDVKTIAPQFSDNGVIATSLVTEDEKESWLRKAKVTAAIGYVVGGLYSLFCLFFMFVFVLAMGSNFDGQNRTRQIGDFFSSAFLTNFFDLIFFPILFAIIYTLVVKIAALSDVLDPILQYKPEITEFPIESRQVEVAQKEETYKADK